MKRTRMIRILSLRKKIKIISPKSISIKLFMISYQRVKDLRSKIVSVPLALYLPVSMHGKVF